MMNVECMYSCILHFPHIQVNTPVFIFFCILSLPLNINENVHVRKSAPGLIRTSFHEFSRFTPLGAGWMLWH